MTRSIRTWRWVVPLVLVALVALGVGTYVRSQAAGDGAVLGGEVGGGDEPTATYTDPGGTFSFLYPRSWGPTTQPDEAIHLTGRDGFMSVRLVAGAPAPLDYGTADASALAAVSPGYQQRTPLKAYTVAGQSGAMVAYTWQSPASAVTGKPVPSSANRYYIPGPGGKLAVFTYSSPTSTYDPAGADDFANAFKWGK